MGCRPWHFETHSQKERGCLTRGFSNFVDFFLGQLS